MKIVINRCIGGFGLSWAGVMEYAKLAGLQIKAYTHLPDSDGYTKFALYKGGKVIHYSTGKLAKDHTIVDGEHFSDTAIPRDDPNLIKTVTNLGKKANGTFADLKIVEIPDGTAWEINDYDGMESVEEKHNTWS